MEKDNAFGRPDLKMTRSVRSVAALLGVLLLSTQRAEGHGMLTYPPSRVGGNLKHAAKGGDMDMDTFNNVSWFTQDATIPGPATNCGKEYLTGIACGTRDATQPWRAPGTAPVWSPCGGFCLDEDTYSPNGCTVGQSYDDDDRWEVKDGRDLPTSARTRWQAGGTAKVAFTALFNHGGGYAYRLCPADASQTEECFQRGHLSFATETSTVHWTSGKEATYPAVTMRNGTHPAGSEWRTIRIPSCSTTTPSICGHELLPKPCAACCAHSCDTWDYSIVDTVLVPKTLPPGDYTLSWRWDAEINHQVWQGCADITVAAKIVFDDDSH